jgi:hypothetical protein
MWSLFITLLLIKFDLQKPDNTTGSSICHINDKEVSETDVSTMAKYFHLVGAGQSSCPSSDWLLDIAKANSTYLKIFINVGFNKGYNFAIWANVWLVITVDYLYYML